MLVQQPPFPNSRTDQYLGTKSFIPTKEAVVTMDLRVQDAKEKRQEIHRAFNDTFTLYEDLFDAITDKAHYMRADPLRHPLIFYLGHTAAFYINKLVLAKTLKYNERIDPSLESLVSVGVDEMSWDDLLSDDYPWPALENVRTFRSQVRELVSQVILERLPLYNNTVIDWEHPFWPIVLAIEHERIHLETSSVLIRHLPLSALNPNYNSFFRQDCKEWDSSAPAAKSLNFVDVPAGHITLGRPMHSEKARTAAHLENLTDIYGWDNEYGHQEAQVNSFCAGEKLISNADFYQFVRDDGYHKEEYWSKEGWHWVQYIKPETPRFWVKKHDGAYVLRNMLEETPTMPWNWPVEINALEANAYCRWYTQKFGRLTRLPTEEEYCHMLRFALEQERQDTGSNPIGPDHLLNNCNIALQKSTSSCPVDKFRTGPFYDIMGNVWQWTKTCMYPYADFDVHPLYDDFTAPTFDDKHNLIKGGSWISTGNEATIYSRYAFRRHFYQHAGFRVVQPADQGNVKLDEAGKEADFEPKNIFVTGNGQETSGNPYETDVQVNRYCESHYGPQPPFPNVQSFQAVSARICEALMRDSEFAKLGNQEQIRALDLGCATGRSTFEMAHYFDQVVGVDLSARFIQVGYQLAQQGSIRYSTPIEGEIQALREVVLGSKELPLNGSEGLTLVEQLFGPQPVDESPNGCHALADKVLFLQGDACNLNATNPVYFNFHCILAANILDRLYNPISFLETIHTRIVPGGFLVILSPNTWLPEFTPQENWIGGKKVDGENVSTRDGLEQVLSPWFDIVRIKPRNPEFQDTFGSGGLDGQLESFHVPFVLRETQRKYEFIFAECTIWKKRA
ncbi:hypothetical protein K493DRAFT_48442 [Basidiobolus meristosporus CBS 931.73]|uniref:Sulfatase-modifying factor enzyme-like domain-containing protein n=1 Tax=Basidiobolus meristosporus CBS 931.73 TaxID=1314790 RepID=A0A1Y1Y164_9FUNG|nr:hypothetical protein K493DRAFT_48442 [Basidiobolus meristosporus CBS 931.73]|eukprot:ORX91743.1 hypothetical protein K493DRAFT_48442 [Basidiobolus meristosporus CBS 931.73]